MEDIIKQRETISKIKYKSHQAQYDLKCKLSIKNKNKKQIFLSEEYKQGPVYDLWWMQCLFQD